jgi:hypothetical protein
MFLTIDRVSKFTVVEFHRSAGKMEGAAFLRHVAAAFPYALHTVLTDNGMAFADLPKTGQAPHAHFWSRTSSTVSAWNTASNIGSPSLTILGPMAKPNE